MCAIDYAVWAILLPEVTFSKPYREIPLIQLYCMELREQSGSRRVVLSESEIGGVPGL